MTIERLCRAICVTNGVNPDDDAPMIFQTIPGFQKDDGKVKQWHTWISTITAPRIVSGDQFEAERKQSRTILQRIIDETDKLKG